MLNNIIGKLGPRFGLMGLTLKRRSPELYLAAGLGTGVAAAVMLAKAHKKSDEVFEEVLEEISDVHDHVWGHNEASQELEEEGEEFHYISSPEKKKMLAPLYLKVVRKAVGLYGPAILMGTGALTLILASHSTLRKRNRALISTLALVERGFNTYRQRVVDELGLEADERFYYGTEVRKTTTIEVGPDGKKKRKKTTKNHIPEEPSPIMYQRIFDRSNQNWDDVDDMNEFFLSSTESWKNSKLQMRGWILLNEVYDALGFEQSPEGAVVGWALDAPGDNFIDFGIRHEINQRDGDDRFVLDFNVNGPVFEFIGEG